MPPDQTNHAPNLRNELLIVLLALASVGLLIFETAAEVEPHQKVLLERVDIAIAFVFLFEWLWRFRKADDRPRFVRRWWWELLAAIPLTNEVAQTLRGVRLLRLVRIIRLLRVIRLGVRLHVMMRHAKTFGEATHLATISTTVASIIFMSAVGFHYFEFGVNQQVRSFWDSVWWSFVTVTTVGYGDIYPITVGGRITAIVLLIIGLSSFGVFTAAVAAWFTRGNQPPD